MKLLLAFAIALLLASCGTTPSKSTPGAGKYYLDDGPPDSSPGDLAAIPDAVPRDEPFHKFANRPYTVFGVTYVPIVNKERTVQRGIASWYGKKFHGQKTASGEVYDMFAMTAAHPTFPIPSFARVTNVKNSRSVVVRINDRGPFHSNRIIDLSYAAAVKIGIAAPGSGLVEVERVYEATQASATIDRTPPPTPALVQTAVVTQEPGGLWLQLGAFSSRESADSFRDKMLRELAWNNEPLQIFSREGLHRVRMGPYRNRDEAGAIADKVRESLGFAPSLIGQ
ncbi:MAG TPA: septal ring lytic transglycosylase RlpA family protein [Usitatibacter sp.]|nr:septal ring lytic transglycosylase RlpA family protein [Usitatibacter sp.]